MSTLHHIDPKPFVNAKPSNGKNTVAHNKAKVKAYLEWIRSQLAKCKDEDERKSYRQYCLQQCQEWSKDVNYHDAVRLAFDIKPAVMKVIYWVQPMFGNRHAIPYGKLLVGDSIQLKECLTKGDLETDDGNQYVLFNRKRYYLKGKRDANREPIVPGFALSETA